MKRFKIIAFACIVVATIASCKKEELKPILNTWVAGNWKRTSLIDTVFSGNTVYAINYLPLSSNPNTLQFTSNTSGISQVYGDFTYSLSGNILTDNKGNTYRIIQLGSTTLELQKRTTGVGYGDFYIKQ